MTGKPVFRELSREECDAVLARHKVGRLAFFHEGQVDIQPINYVFRGEWLTGRTQPGTKLTMLQKHPYVAFEVDEAEGPYDWRSVVMKGTVYLLSDASTKTAVAERRDAIAAIRELTPDAFTDKDPAPYRTVLFRIFVREVSGRMASSAPPAP
ncbi:MAG TPA: pyridoxamine 5'-phosphate oxidase family protein [Gemmatimonadales bacterium]|nr:pyridoxamine 5'-phosphate oxidase family protein [Gemmatimonadales bacterium]